MAARLSDCLVLDGTVTTEVVRLAIARRAVYGGALDTALLELSAVDEPTLWGKLAVATGAPIPDAGMFESPDPTAAAVFDVVWSRRCRAVPVGQRDGVIQICCSEPFDETQLAKARDALGVKFEVFVVPEVRLAAARQAVYGEPMPPRLLRVLARLLGAQPVRKWVKALSPQKPIAAAAEVPASATPVHAATGAKSAPARAPGGQVEDGELTEAEFDVPINTQGTGPADILESRPSRAAMEAQAADEVARALDLGASAAPGATLTALEPAGLPVPAAAPADGPGALVVAPASASDTLPGRAVFRTPSPLPTLESLSDEKESELCATAYDADAAGRLAALRALRGRFDRPRVCELADKLQEDLKGPTERAVLAAGALGELRNARAVPALIEALKGPASLVQTAARALVEIAQQDFGQSRKKWLAWWEAHKKSDRISWLLEGLSHKSSEIRFSSSEELRIITGQYFGYHYDLPKREREEARERWQAWWYQSGHARLPDRR
jgi:hypothetical protein